MYLPIVLRKLASCVYLIVLFHGIGVESEGIDKIGMLCELFKIHKTLLKKLFSYIVITTL